MYPKAVESLSTALRGRGRAYFGPNSSAVQLDAVFVSVLVFPLAAASSLCAQFCTKELPLTPDFSVEYRYYLF